MATTSTPKKGPKPKFRQWRPRFIAALREYGVVSYAAEEAGIDRSTAYKAKNRNGRFAAEWEDALGEATDALEKEARRRAVDGVDKPVTWQGEITDTYTEYSDTLLIFLLKAHRPEKFRERYEITGAEGGPLVVEYVNDWRNQNNHEE